MLDILSCFCVICYHSTDSFAFGPSIVACFGPSIVACIGTSIVECIPTSDTMFNLLFLSQAIIATDRHNIKLVTKYGSRQHFKQRAYVSEFI